MKIFETLKCSGQKNCQIPHVNFEMTSQFLFKFCVILHCHDINPLWILSSYFFKFGLKNPIKIPILSALEKICHIPDVIFQTRSQLKVMLNKSVNNVLDEGM